MIYSVNAEVVLKATNVDGVFDDDPKRNPQARLLDTLTYQDVITKDLSVMDLTAITLCQENNIPGKSSRQNIYEILSLLKLSITTQIGTIRFIVLMKCP
jgi:uridylate kinase